MHVRSCVDLMSMKRRSWDLSFVYWLLYVVCIKLYYDVDRSMLSCIVSYMLYHYIISYHIISYHIISYHIISYHIISYIYIYIYIHIYIYIYICIIIFVHIRVRHALARHGARRHDGDGAPGVLQGARRMLQISISACKLSSFGRPAGTWISIRIPVYHNISQMRCSCRCPARNRISLPSHRNLSTHPHYHSPGMTYFLGRYI